MRPLVTLILLALAAAPVHAAGDLVLVNGRILVDAGAPAAARFAEAALVVDGRFAAVGGTAEVEAAARARGARARRIDLRGRFAVPALTDAHAHVEGLGHWLQRLRLQGTTSAEAVGRLVAERARAAPADEWILGGGWDQNDWPVQRFPTSVTLDRAAPGRRVWLERVDGHAGWASTRALADAGITKDTPDPPGGRIERGPDGTPTGVLVDDAMALVDRLVPPPTRAQRRRAIELAARRCAEVGLTAVHDAGIDAEAVALYRELAGAGRLPIRVFAMLGAATASAPGGLPREKAAAGGGRFRVFGVKAYADGALGSRGAALLEPYADDPGNRGLLRAAPDSIEALARRCLEHGYALGVHAIGDRGNRETLDAFARAGVTADRRFRVEHAQVLALDDVPRFAQLGVIASMQPTHCTSDMPWAPQRLGADRVAGAYAWRRLLDAGARLALGSDFPVEDVNPLLGLYAAVTTQQLDGTPAEGFRPGERLTIWEALRGFTTDAAHASFAEDEVGRAVPGLRADLAVFDRDLTAIPARELPAARCVMTIVDGDVVWEAKR